MRAVAAHLVQRLARADHLELGRVARLRRQRARPVLPVHRLAAQHAKAAHVVGLLDLVEKDAAPVRHARDHEPGEAREHQLVHALGERARLVDLLGPVVVGGPAEHGGHGEARRRDEGGGDAHPDGQPVGEVEERGHGGGR